jgi:hypothetical protein
MEAKKILSILAVLIVSSIAFAGVVTYLSNTANASVDVQSPVDNQLTGADIEGVEVDPTSAMVFYNGETLTLESTLDNKSRVAQNGQLQVVITPSLVLTGTDPSATVEDIDGSTVVTYPAITIPVDDPMTEETDESIVIDESSFTMGNNEPAEYNITTIFNIADEE